MQSQQVKTQQVQQQLYQLPHAQNPRNKNKLLDESPETLEYIKLNHDEKMKKMTQGNRSNKTLVNTFNTTYYILIISAIITLLSSFIPLLKPIRYVFILESIICIIASYYYHYFIKNLNTMDWTQITQTRYTDWAITTPIMLISLCILLSHNIKEKINTSNVLIIIAMNYLMLFIGYIGEMYYYNMKLFFSILGFIPFFIMFYIIYTNYYGKNIINKYIFHFYVILWGLYGIFYLLDPLHKNITYNILDCITKGLFGIVLIIFYYFFHF